MQVKVDVKVREIKDSKEYKKAQELKRKKKILDDTFKNIFATSDDRVFRRKIRAIKTGMPTSPKNSPLRGNFVIDEDRPSHRIHVIKQSKPG